MNKLIPLMVLAMPLAVFAQKYKTCTLSQFKWDDSTDKKIVCIEHYNDKGKISSKEYLNSQSVVDAEEDGDDKGTKVFYSYKDNLLLGEYRFRGQEYEDSVITNNSYDAKGQLVLQVIRRHEKYTDSNAVSRWKWISDTLNFSYDSKGRLAASRGGEKWHKIAYTGKLNDSRDTSYSSPEDLKAKNYIVTSSNYLNEKQLHKKVKEHYIKGKKHFSNIIEYSYTDSQLTKLHSTATSYSKNKIDDTKLDNMRFDKKFFYYKDGKLQSVETWDPEGFRLLTTMYEYK